MEKLPYWRLTNPHPAFYDSESGSAIQMVAKVYAAMNELIEEHNTYIEGLNTRIDEFMSTANTEREEFAVAMRQEFQDFIDIIDLKIQGMEKSISDMVDGLPDLVKEGIQNALKDGTLVIITQYNDETEELDFVATLGEGAS